MGGVADTLGAWLMTQRGGANARGVAYSQWAWLITRGAWLITEGAWLIIAPYLGPPGGQKARVVFAELACREPDVLVLVRGGPQKGLWGVWGP